jgi:hypothetical protein
LTLVPVFLILRASVTRGNRKISKITVGILGISIRILGAGAAVITVDVQDKWYNYILSAL